MQARKARDNDKKAGLNYVYSSRSHIKKGVIPSEKLSATNYSPEEDFEYLQGMFSTVTPNGKDFDCSNLPVPSLMAKQLYNKIEGIIKAHHLNTSFRENLNKIKDLEAFRQFLQRRMRENFQPTQPAPKKEKNEPVVAVTQSTTKISTALARRKRERHLAKRQENRQKSLAEVKKLSSDTRKRGMVEAPIAKQPPLKKRDLSQSLPTFFSAGRQEDHALSIEKETKTPAEIRQDCEKELMNMIVDEFNRVKGLSK